MSAPASHLPQRPPRALETRAFIPLAAALAWAGGGDGWGWWLLAGVPIAYLLTASVALFAKIHDLRVHQLHAAGGVLGTLLAVPALFVGGIDAILAGALSFWAFVTAGRIGLDYEPRYPGAPDPEARVEVDGKAAPDLPSRTVQAAPAESRPMERAVSVIGALAAIDQATLSVKVSGRLQSLSVDLGTRVKRGELVAQIESVDYELKLRSAEALLAQARARLGLLLVGADDAVKAEETSTVRQAKASLLESQKQRDRTRELAKRGISSQADLEIVEANSEIAFSRHLEAIEDIRQRQGVLQQRRVEVEIARQQLADAKILAPFDGIVADLNAIEGGQVTEGTMLVRIEKDN